MSGTNRQVLLLDLVDDAAAIARYEAWHRAGQVPAAVIAAIRAADIRAMEIWRRADRLVMIMETGPAFDSLAKAVNDAASPDIMAWEALMDTMQRRLPGTGAAEKWAGASRIFSLDDDDDDGGCAGG